MAMHTRIYFNELVIPAPVAQAAAAAAVVIEKVIPAPALADQP
jgi:hypothetical protein